MKIFNAIQMLALLILSPTLLSLCHSGEFPGAGVLFWGGLIVSLILFVWVIILICMGLDKE